MLFSATVVEGQIIKMESISLIWVQIRVCGIVKNNIVSALELMLYENMVITIKWERYL